MSTEAWSQEVLEFMHREKQRPICPCRAPGIEMYIAKIGDRFYVKRMPNTGGKHDPECESYEPPPELSGLGGVLGTAIKENAEDGLTELKLDFALSKLTRKKPLAAGDGQSDTVKSDGSKLTLRSLLYYLWDQAGFTKWTPAMEGKRKWGVIQKYLYTAAGGKVTKGQGLSERIYIPETFILDHKEAIHQRQLSMFSKLAGKQSGSQQLMIVIGEVKGIAEARFGYKMLVKHMPDMPLMMEEDIYNRLYKRFGVEISLSNNLEGSHLMFIGTASISTAGIVSLEEAALMIVTENWIPIENVYEKSLIDTLTSGKRKFIKGLRYNLPQHKPLACVVVPDTAPKPTAMYIIPPDADDEFINATTTLIEGSEMGSWLWNTKEKEVMPSMDFLQQQGEQSGGDGQC